MTNNHKPALRQAFGRFATGIAVITTLDTQGAPYGLTINSFVSVSMDPPLISWNVIRGSTAHQIISQQGRFVVNILAHDQKQVAQQMTGPIENRFDGMACSVSDDGLPLIDGALAAFECDTHALIEAGDHDIILGRVSRFTHHEGPPLVYWKGRYASATPDA